jgi:glycosyltransferase involved in cell wall biosynthesis
MAGRNRCLFSATDLSSPGKIDVDLVKSLISAGDVALRFVGRCNPFGGDSETSLGEIRDRHRMAELLRTSQALVFCSRMDNAPLTIMEALVSGCYVLAYPSPAAKEILELVGGSCVSDRVSMISLIRNGNPAVLYGGVSPGELAARARARFSGSAMTTSYLNLYKQAVSSEFGTPSDQPGRSGLGSKR